MEAELELLEDERSVPPIRKVPTVVQRVIGRFRSDEFAPRCKVHPNTRGIMVESLILYDKETFIFLSYGGFLNSAIPIGENRSTLPQQP